jgi:hypothetical protein
MYYVLSFLNCVLDMSGSWHGLPRMLPYGSSVSVDVSHAARAVAAASAAAVNVNVTFAASTCDASADDAACAELCCACE